MALLGDINLDSAIDLIDMVLLQKHIVGAIDFTPLQKQLADVNLDGFLNASDIVRYKIHLLDLELIAGEINTPMDVLKYSVTGIVDLLLSLIHYIFLNPVLFLGLALWLAGCTVCFTKRVI